MNIIMSILCNINVFECVGSTTALYSLLGSISLLRFPFIAFMCLSSAWVFDMRKFDMSVEYILLQDVSFIVLSKYDS